MNDQVNAIVDYLIQIHEAHADGCKGSCHEREVGFHNSTYYDTYWYCRFGGYCIGNLSRSTEVRAATLEELLPKIRETVEQALVELDLPG